MTRFLISFHAKTKGQLNIHKWPAKCENHKCFLSCKFPVIQYASILMAFFSMNSTIYKAKGCSSQFALNSQNRILVSMLETPTEISVYNINDLRSLDKFIGMYGKTTSAEC